MKKSVIENEMQIETLKNVAKNIRSQLIDISYHCKVPHLGSSLSCVDILVACYFGIMNIDIDNPKSENRDRFILSKGHAAAALYTTLAARGYFQKSLLMKMGKPGCILEEHPGPGGINGIEAATGSLGHGLSIGLGMALAGRILNHRYNIYVVLSDGECNEGSVWEAAMFAAGYQLDNVIAIIDFNKWQATGKSCEIMALEPLSDKWKAFGWNCEEIDGHNMNSLINVLSNVPANNKPTVIIANTVKGKGVSFMEDDNNWHYRIPNQNEVQMAKKELMK